MSSILRTYSTRRSAPGNLACLDRGPGLAGLSRSIDLRDVVRKERPRASGPRKPVNLGSKEANHQSGHEVCAGGTDDFNLCARRFCLKPLARRGSFTQWASLLETVSAGIPGVILLAPGLFCLSLFAPLSAHRLKCCLKSPINRRPRRNCSRNATRETHRGKEKIGVQAPTLP